MAIPWEGSIILIEILNSTLHRYMRILQSNYLTYSITDETVGHGDIKLE